MWKTRLPTGDSCDMRVKGLKSGCKDYWCIWCGEMNGVKDRDVTESGKNIGKRLPYKKL